MKYKVEVKVVQTFTHYIEAPSESSARVLAHIKQEECEWNNVSFREVEKVETTPLEEFPENHQSWLEREVK